MTEHPFQPGVAPYVGRMAPSPTGALHLGIARACLCAWLDARKKGGQLVLRIEDLDGPRTVPGSEESILRDLEWLGLDWDEGPNQDHGRGPHRQSERFAHYVAALETLSKDNRTFGCTCSRKEIAQIASAPHGNVGHRYPGTCRDGFKQKDDRTPAVRFRTLPKDQVTHQDQLYGLIRENVHECAGDFVLKRADGLWAYQLAVSVDDWVQGITCIVRGSDLLMSTPRQLLLRRLLDPQAAPLQTLHIPLLLDSTGERMAKRHGATAIATFRSAGYTSEQVIGALAASLRLVPYETVLSAKELIEKWNPEKIPTTNGNIGDARFDI